MQGNFLSLLGIIQPELLPREFLPQVLPPQVLPPQVLLLADFLHFPDFLHFRKRPPTAESPLLRAEFLLKPCADNKPRYFPP